MTSSGRSRSRLAVANSRLLARHLFQQLVNGLVKLSLGGNPVPPIADDALGVDQHEGRPAFHVPGSRNRAIGAAAVPERAPGDVLLFQDFLQFVAALVAVDADEGEWFAFELLHER